MRRIALVILVTMAAGCDRSPDPGEEGYSLENRTVFVVNGLAETLSAIDLESGVTWNDLLDLGRWPNDLTSSPDGRALYVVNSGDNQVMEIDPFQGIVTMTFDIGIGENPWECESAGEELWVSSFLTGEISIVSLADGGSPERLSVGGTLQSVLIAGETVYVTDTAYQYGDFGQGRVIRLDRPSRAETGTGTVGTNPQDLLLDGSGRLHVLCSGDYSGEGSGEVHLLDAATLAPIDTLDLGGRPSSMCLDAEGMIYVAGYWGGVMVYRADDLSPLHDASTPLVAGDGFTDIVFDPGTGLLYVADFDADRVLGVDPSTGQIAASYGVGDGPLRLTIVEP